MTRQTPGQQSTDAVTDSIAAAVGGLCACGCGATLDPAGPSGWFASERCQARWQRGDRAPESVEEYQRQVDAAIRSGDVTRAIDLMLNPAPAVREELERAEIERLREQFRPRVVAPMPPRRRPVVESRTPGVSRLPFVGGPWHGDLRNMTHYPLPFVWRVPKPADLTVFDMTAPMTVLETVDYELRTISGWMPDRYDTEVWQVYAARGSIAEELRDALAIASRAGWEPWESSTTRVRRQS